MSLCSSSISCGLAPPDSAARLWISVYVLLHTHTALQETDGCQIWAYRFP